MINIPTVKDALDWHIHFTKSNNGKNEEKPSPFNWVSDESPLTLRSVYPELKKLFELSENVENSTKSDIPNNLSENVENSTKSDITNNFHQGHRKQMFTEEQKQNIICEYTHYNTPKTQLAKKYHCSEKTIRNILKYALKGE